MFRCQTLTQRSFPAFNKINDVLCVHHALDGSNNYHIVKAPEWCAEMAQML